MVTSFSFLIGLLGCRGYGTDLFGAAGGQGGDGASGGNSSTGGEGGAGGSNVGGEGGSIAQGGAGGNAGSSSTGGTGGGGQGGSGGGSSCNDPPENDAVTFDCTNACFKVLVSNGGITIAAKSSNDDDACEPTQPFITHPGDGESLLVWVYDPPNNNPFVATSLGDYPTTCYVKCANQAPTPGPAPDHSEMEFELLSGGYVQTACGTAPGITLGQTCANGMYTVENF